MSQSHPVALRETLQEAEQFIAGFEDDEAQQPLVSTLLAKLHAQIAQIKAIEQAATTFQEAENAAREAIKHLLQRFLNDPKLAFYFSSATHSMEELTKAHALLHGLDLEQFRKTYYHDLQIERPQCRTCGGAV